MIKTHRPRGHIWTCASLFQQTKDFRNICYEEFIPPKASIIYPDSLNRLSDSERASKRRRIEDLADDFLNGQSLTVTSARPCGTSLRTTIEWNERSRTAQKFNLLAAESGSPDSELWTDIDDDEAVLDNFINKYGPDNVARQTRIRKQRTIVEERAQASCGQALRSRSSRLSSEPSTGALKQAAALRNLQPGKVMDRGIPEPDDPSSLKPATIDSCHDTALILRPQVRSKPPTARSEWLLRRNTTLHALSVDESADELRCSRDDTPTRIPRAVTPSIFTRPEDERTDSQSSAPNVLTARSRTVQGPVSQDELRLSYRTPRADQENRTVPSQDRLEASSGTHRDSPTPQRTASYHTAPEPRVQSPTQVPQFEQGRLPADYADRSLANVVANEHGPQLYLDRTDRVTWPNISTATSPNRQRSVPSMSHDNGEKSTGFILQNRRTTRSLSAYKTVQPTQIDTTPFMYRQRGIGGKGNKSKSAQVSLPHTTSKAPLDADTVGTKPAHSSENNVAEHAPLLDMTFGHDSSFAPGLSMALVDNHLNTKLPADPTSGGRSSTLKKALRREMRESGAEIIGLPGEPNSSQPEELPIRIPLDSSQTDTLKAQHTAGRSKNQSQWPGTQLLLQKAEHDLFHSQAEFAPSGDPLNVNSPEHLDEAASMGEPAINARTPLRVLLQEKVPSTQAILDSWSPWSALRRTSNTMTAMQKQESIFKKVPTANHAGSKKTMRPQATSFDERAVRRRSSLRFSTVSTESPTRPSQLQYTVSKRRHSMRHVTARSFDSVTVPTPRSILRKTSKDSDSMSRPPASSAPLPRDITTVISMEDDTTAAHPMSEDISKPLSLSFQPAQLLREDSDPYRTMDEITEFVMGGEDISGLLSQ